MSIAAKEEIARLEAELVYIDSILLAMRQAAEAKRRTTHSVHLEPRFDVEELRYKLEIEKVGLTSRKRRLEIMLDSPKDRANLNSIQTNLSTTSLTCQWSLRYLHRGGANARFTRPTVR